MFVFFWIEVPQSKEPGRVDMPLSQFSPHEQHWAACRPRVKRYQPGRSGPNGAMSTADFSRLLVMIVIADAVRLSVTEQHQTRRRE
jgi:hypothetical protein